MYNNHILHYHTTKTNFYKTVALSVPNPLEQVQLHPQMTVRPDYSLIG